MSHYKEYGINAAIPGTYGMDNRRRGHRLTLRSQQSREDQHDYDPCAHLWRINWKQFGYPFCGIYVVSPDNRWPSKIGISQVPVKRLNNLQVSCWKQLDIAEYRYVENQRIARAIEQKCHAFLTADGKLLKGEWFDIKPDKALDVIKFCAISAGVELRNDVPDEKIRKAISEFFNNDRERKVRVLTNQVFLE